MDPRFEGAARPAPRPPATPAAPSDFLGLGEALSSSPVPPSTPHASATPGLAHGHAPTPPLAPLQGHARAQAHTHAQAQAHAQRSAAPLRPGASPVANPGSHRNAESALQWLDDASTAVLEETRHHLVFGQAPSASPQAAPIQHAPTPHAFTPPAQAAPAQSHMQPHTHAQPHVPPTPSISARAPSTTRSPLAGLMQNAVPNVAPPSAPSVRPNSWLLELDDARAGRAGLDPVIHDPHRVLAAPVPPTPLSASFSEPPPVVERTMPWIVRGLLAAGAAGFLFVIGYTLTRPRMVEQAVVETPVPTVQSPRSKPVQLEAPRAVRTAADAKAGANPASNPAPNTAPNTAHSRTAVTATPNARAAGGANRGSNVGRPAAAVAPTRALVPDAPPVRLEVPPAEFAPVLQPPSASGNGAPGDGVPREGASTTPNVRAERAANPAGAELATASAIPASSWLSVTRHAPALARGEIGPKADELAASPERRERVDRWLLVQSRGATPDLDASGEYVPRARTPLTASMATTPAPLASPVAYESNIDATAEVVDPLLQAVANTPADATSSEPQATNVDALVGAESGATETLAPEVVEVLAAAAVVPAPVAVVTNPASAPAPVVTVAQMGAQSGAQTGASARWEANVVPVEQIDGKSRILTPKVGRVRVSLDGGDTIEGQLYAVGEGRVWVDAPVGRIALQREQIEKLEQIASAPEPAPTPVLPQIRVEPPVASTPTSPAPATAPAVEPTPLVVDDAAALAPNARVKVSTAGGIFYGRIQSKDGDSITLVTDEGAHVTVDRADVAAAPEKPTVVKPKKGAAGKAKTAPAKSPLPPKPAEPAPSGTAPAEPR